MADVTVTITRATLPYTSADLVGSGTAFTTGQTGAVDVSGDTTEPYDGGEDRLEFLIEETGGSTGSVVFDAGDYPPSALADEGAYTVALAANDLLKVVLEPGRHLQNDGTITWTFTGTGRVRVVRSPRA